MVAKEKQKKQSGFSTLEILPIIVLFLMMTSLSLGFFSITHTAILQSISARSYAMDTMTFRTYYGYFHDQRAAVNYRSFGYRFHGSRNEGASSSDLQFRATARSLSSAFPVATENENNAGVHRSEPFTAATSPRWQSVGVNPVWIQTSYGICLNPRCGGQ